MSHRKDLPEIPKLENDDVVSHGSLAPKHERNWTRRGGAEVTEEQRLLANLKTVSTLNKDTWLALARWYKNRQKFEEAEIAYVGARYCAITDRDLMLEWMGVFQLNRATEMTKEELLRNANITNQGLFDVVNAPQERVLHECQMLIHHLERPMGELR